MRHDSPQALIRGPTRAFCYAALGLGLAFASYSQGFAQDKAREAESPPPLSATVYELLKSARTQMEEARPAAARDALQELLNDTQSLHAYETALVQQALGYALAALGQATAAARNFQKSLASGQLPEAVNQELRLRAGLAFLQAELHLEGVALLEQWLTAEPQPALAPRLALALAYHHLGHRGSLLPLLEQALREDPPQREDWLLLLLSTRLENAEHREALPVLRELLALRPDKRDYWLLLVASQEALGQATSALATHELAYQQGVLQADDLLHLAHRYLERHRPYAAARLLHQESGKFAPHHHAMLELEGEAWRLAHDPTAAIQTWQTLLQQTPDKLVIGLRLAHLYLKQERWEEALALLGELPGEGSPTQEAEHRLLLGISATRAGHPEQARTALLKAAGHKDTRKTACAWLATLSPKTKALHTTACAANTTSTEGTADQRDKADKADKAD